MFVLFENDFLHVIDFIQCSLKMTMMTKKMKTMMKRMMTMKMMMMTKKMMTTNMMMKLLKLLQNDRKNLYQVCDKSDNMILMLKLDLILNDNCLFQKLCNSCSKNIKILKQFKKKS